MLLFEFFVWATLGLMVGLMLSYFNLIAGSGWRASLVGVAGGVLGGVLLALIPGAHMDGFDWTGVFGSLVGALGLTIVFARLTGRQRPME